MLPDSTTAVPVDNTRVYWRDFIAGISVAIGIVNLLPIPILDGGHLVFYALEAIRRKPVEEKMMALCYRFGLIIVLSLMGLGILSDVLRSFGG